MCLALIADINIMDAHGFLPLAVSSQLRRKHAQKPVGVIFDMDGLLL
jgi:hypothetical protein